uniref:Uncharacterized protein n=1 Tax=Anguilla anguilla TaxID=7936 RepID=A0A0E9XQZ0_ANGAN
MGWGLFLIGSICLACFFFSSRQLGVLKYVPFVASSVHVGQIWNKVLEEMWFLC